jgi:hypothetical protein
MSNEILANERSVIPILVKQVEELELYRSLRKWGPLAKWNCFLATQEVLQLILINRPMVDQTKQTVWHFWKRYGEDTPHRSFHEKVGRGFSDISFANECFILSGQKAQENIYSEFNCSYQFDDFEDDQFGVSIRLTFELVSLTGKTRTINCVSGIVGLNGWENLALGLGLNYRLGLIKPYHRQVQNILRIADESVENKSSDFRPKGNSICHYVRNLFYLINRDLPRRTTINTTT